MYMILCAHHVCRNLWKPELDGCEQPNEGIGTKLRSPESTESARNCEIISLAPVFS